MKEESTSMFSLQCNDAPPKAEKGTSGNTMQYMPRGIWDPVRDKRLDCQVEEILLL